MPKKEVESIKNTQKNYIKEIDEGFFGNRNTCYYSFGNEELRRYACFADLGVHILRRQKEKKLLFHHLIRLSTEHYKIVPLQKELNQVFGGYAKIVRYLSGRKNYRIFEVRQTKEFPSVYLQIILINQIGVLMRFLDGEFYNKRDSLIKRGKGPYGDWKTLIQDIYSTYDIYGHGINDKFYSAKKKDLGEEIDKYFNTLSTIFSGDFVFDPELVNTFDKYMKKYSRGYGGIGQTKQHLILESLFVDKEKGRWEKGVE